MASTAAVSLVAAVRYMPSAGATRAGLLCGGPPGTRAPKRQLAVCHIRCVAPQQDKHHTQPQGIAMGILLAAAVCKCTVRRSSSGLAWACRQRMNALRPPGACKPLSVLCCRSKVSAEAVCKEKVRSQRQPGGHYRHGLHLQLWQMWQILSSLSGVAANSMNAVSTRSHAISTIHIRQRRLGDAQASALDCGQRLSQSTAGPCAYTCRSAQVH